MATPTAIDPSAVVTQTTTTAAPYIPLVIAAVGISLIGTLFLALRKLAR